MKPAVLFTIIVPTFDHEDTLRYSLKSIQRQTVRDFQVHVIGDGATKKASNIVKKFVESDTRFFYHGFPKSQRTGEEYRHEVLSTINSKYVCYLSDDDLWFPDHLVEMGALLAKADFVYTFPLMIKPDGKVNTWYGDLTKPFYRQLFLAAANKRYNVVPLSCGGHTLAAYRKLPRGWESTPQGKHTDLHMWQVFLSQPHLTIAKSALPTVLHFASSQRRKDTPQKRVAELADWWQRLEKQSSLREALLANTLSTVYDDFLEFRAAVQSTKTWRLHDKLLDVIAKIKS